MSKPVMTFKESDRVKVKGKAGVHVVTRSMLIPTPTIVDFAFTMVDVEVVKFITPEESFYALARDCSPAPQETKAVKKEKKR